MSMISAHVRARVFHLGTISSPTCLSGLLNLSHILHPFDEAVFLKSLPLGLGTISSPTCLSDLLNLSHILHPFDEAVFLKSLPLGHFASHDSGPMEGMLAFNIQLFSMSSIGNM